MGAVVIAAAARRAEERIIEHLRREGATRADRATDLDVESHLEHRRLERLVNARAVRQEPNGRFWLDEAIYDAYRSDRRGLILVVIAVLGVTLAGIVIAQMMR